MPQLKKYNPRDFTWGYELELGDVPRNVDIPEILGAWEYAETDIVNLKEPYKYIAADPLGLSPPMGGEINTVPTRTVTEQLHKIDSILNWFTHMGYEPTACSSVMEAHVHVHVPGLKEDIAALKNLTRFIGQHQHQLIEHCVQYVEHPLMKKTKTARTYLKWDMGRPMPDYMVQNILSMANNFDDFIRIQCCGKDGVSRGRPFRYAVNTYCLKHTDTIEFRCFRATTNMEQIGACFKFVRYFLEHALNEIQIPKLYTGFRFPPFVYDHAAYLGWEKTKWSKERGKKQRRYVEVH